MFWYWHQIGDKAILQAMIQLEKDTIMAYERMIKHEKQWPESKTVLIAGLADKKGLLLYRR